MISSYNKCLICGGNKIILSFHQRKKKIKNKKGLKYKNLSFFDGKNHLKITRGVVSVSGKNYQSNLNTPPKMCACFGGCSKLRPVSSEFSKDTFYKTPNYIINICFKSYTK